MEKLTWTIVQFMTDNTIEVLSIWIEHDKYYWPPFKYEQIRHYRRNPKKCRIKNDRNKDSR